MGMDIHATHGLADSGERTTFETGGQREPKGLRAYFLVPRLPLFRLAVLYGQGALKYAPRNWQRGLKISTFLNGMWEHTAKLSEGSTDEDHASAVAWNSFGYTWTMNEIEAGRLPRSLDDRELLVSVPDGHYHEVVGAAPATVPGEIPGQRPATFADYRRTLKSITTEAMFVSLDKGVLSMMASNGLTNPDQ